MNYELSDTYPSPSNLDFGLILQLTIDNGFIGLSDLMDLKNVDKYFNETCKKYIDKYFEILSKCYNTHIIIPKYPSFNDNDDEFNLLSYNYENKYWYDLFGKKLNRDELVLYYGYFINKATESINSYSSFAYCSKTWKIVMFEDGFIKSFDYKYTNLSDSDIIMKVTLYYATTIYLNKRTKHYWKSEIIFENKKQEKIETYLINTKLLDKLLTTFNYIDMVSNKKI
jgi:hypothetical protein